MSEYTKGPWFWENDVLCNKDFIVGGRDHSFNESNKRLIAAAPELLEALQSLLMTQILPEFHAEKCRKVVVKALGQ